MPEPAAGGLEDPADVAKAAFGLFLDGAGAMASGLEVGWDLAGDIDEAVMQDGLGVVADRANGAGGLD